LSIPFFDCNVMFGPRSAPRPESALSDEEILEELARTGVDRALFVHAWAKEYDPRIGNEKAAELAAAHANLTPAFVLLPEHTEELPAGDALLAYLDDGGARAVRLYPKPHGYGLGEAWCGGLFATLAEAGVPVVIDLDQTSWGEIEGVLGRHPGLNLIVCRTGYRITRWAYPLLARHAGLRIETSFFEQHLGIETVVEKFGADRLVFGTGLPEYDAGGAISPILYAAIEDADRLCIAAGNLESILWKGARS
jgi:predicted TIM-barrel fold metal-dependent hydrolase